MHKQGLVLITLVSLFSALGQAQEAPVRIAVLRGPFIVEETGFDSIEQAEIVRKHASDGIRLDAGYEVIDPKVVDSAAVRVAGSLPDGRAKPCGDDSCLSEVSRLASATGAVQLEVTKKRDGSYAITVRSAVTPPQTDEVDRGVAVVLEVARRLAGGTSRRIAENSAQIEAVPLPQPQGVTEAEPHPKPDTAVPTPVQTGPFDLHRAWFFGSLGLTGAVGLTWAIVEGVAWGKIQDAEKNEERTNADVDELRGPQVGARVLLISTATLAVTTAVLAIFTDFSEEKEPAATVVP
ncbi:MAG: hypothetical protein MUC50_20285, partial [Myxococcota bacterium]|nr:hypothetical protein [Myxococcota bacterium]